MRSVSGAVDRASIRCEGMEAGHVEIDDINAGHGSEQRQRWSSAILALILRSRHYSFTMTIPASMPLLAVKEPGQSCGHDLAGGAFVHRWRSTAQRTDSSAAFYVQRASSR